MKNKNVVPFVFVVLTIVLGIGFQVLVTSPLAKYQGYHPLEWKSFDACSPKGLPAALATHVRGVGTYQVHPTAGERSCRSTAFAAPAVQLEFEVAAETVDSGQLEIYSIEDQKLAAAKLPSAPAGQWVRLTVQLPKAVIGTEIFVVLRQSKTSSWIAVRDRLNLYQPTLSSTLLETLKLNPITANIIVFLLAGLLCRYCYWLIDSHSSDRVFFLTLLGLTVLVHFRFDTFLFWDEWNILDRFRSEGVAGIFHIHNEHFIPLFLLFYFMESILFGATYQGYLLVSLLLHTINAWLLYSIVRQLSESTAAARILAVLFALSGMHSEVLHWAFEQSVLLSQIFTFLAIGEAIEYYRKGETNRLWKISAYSALAPLFFGNGFIVFIQIAIVLSFLVFTNLRQLSFLFRVKRMLFATVSSGGVLFVPAVFYVLARNKVAEPFLNASFVPTLRGLTDYVFVGTQLGSVLRGIGLFPSLLLQQAAPQTLRAVALYVPDPLLFWSSPEIICASVGVVAGIGLLLLSLLGRRRREALVFWCAGQLLLASVFVLPGLVRWQIGTFQALALRYQYCAFLGFSCIVLPALLYVLSCRQYDLENSGNRIAKSFRLALTIGLYFHIAINLYRSQNFTFFTNNGRQNRTYLSELVHWREQLASHNTASYEGLDSPLYGLQPLYPTTITPRDYPVDIYSVLNWLNPWKYPSSA